MTNSDMIRHECWKISSVSGHVKSIKIPQRTAECYAGDNFISQSHSKYL